MALFLAMGRQLGTLADWSLNFAHSSLECPSHARIGAKKVLPLATRQPSWLWCVVRAQSGLHTILATARGLGKVSRAAHYACKNPDGVNRSVTSGRLRESASKLLIGRSLSL